MIFGGQDTVYTVCVCLHFSKALVSKVGREPLQATPKEINFGKKFQCIPVNIQL